ncbi:MAG: MOSC domain-containing protein [Candidatus Heimdallarchaeota archaeon]|nr:MOSC domain-containing protein [Candidatus Heimdallarchaeota archaeon]
MPYVLSINAKEKTVGERGIPKMCMKVANVSSSGIIGDYNIYRTEDKASTKNRALLLYTTDKLVELQEEGWPVNAGHLGENITIDGLGYAELRIGDRWRLGEIEIEITEECHPCSNLRVLPYVGDEKIKEFIKTLQGRRGMYAKVLKGGKLKILEIIEKLD